MNNSPSTFSWRTFILCLVALPFAVGTMQLLTSTQIPAFVRLIVGLLGAVVVPVLGLWYVRRWLAAQAFTLVERQLYWIGTLLFAGLVAVGFGGVGLHAQGMLPTTFPLVISLPLFLICGICVLHLAQHVNSNGQIEHSAWRSAGIFAVISMLALGAIIVFVS